MEAQRYVGEQVTVIDARGVRGPGTVVEVSPFTFDLRVDFEHSTGERCWPAGRGWLFRVQDHARHGLRLEFPPRGPETPAAVPAIASGPDPEAARDLETAAMFRERW